MRQLELAAEERQQARVVVDIAQNAALDPRRDEDAGHSDAGGGVVERRMGRRVVRTLRRFGRDVVVEAAVLVMQDAEQWAAIDRTVTMASRGPVGISSWPWHEPIMAKKRLGQVGPGTDANHRSHTANCLARPCSAGNAPSAK